MTTKVSKQAARAFWNHRPFGQGSTAVTVTDDKVQMTLHGNVIAETDTNTLQTRITNAGWPTATTRDRLTGIMLHVGHIGEDLPRQQDHKQYLFNDVWDGGWHTVPFAKNVA